MGDIYTQLQHIVSLSAGLHSDLHFADLHSDPHLAEERIGLTLRRVKWATNTDPPVLGPGCVIAVKKGGPSKHRHPSLDSPSRALGTQLKVLSRKKILQMPSVKGPKD